MPRVTRRSLASKEDSSSQEESPAKATPTRRGRGAKKEEPVEDVKADEPQEVPAKRGRSSARGAKAEKTETPVVEQKGRGRSRSTRGKKDEEEEKEAPKGRGRGGRSTSARGKKAAEEEETSEDTPTETKGRGGRAARGKKAAEEENAEDGATEEDNSTPPAKGRAGRGRAKAVPSPSPRGGRRGRSAPAEEEPAAAEAVKADETKASAESEQAEATATTGRGRRSTPSKPAESPASSGRRGRGRGQKSEETVAASSTAEEEKEENKEAESEAMETDKPSEEAVPEAQQEKQEKEDESSSSKKRKLDEEEAEANESLSAKRARTSEAEPSSETATEKEDELTDFVVVNKEDVPAPDSKEVTDSIAKAIPSAPPSEADSMEKGEENSSSSSEINASGTCMPAPNVPLIVPLTEAELAKQYTKVQRDDKDENSSTMVEVGSEGASDITGVSSVRGFDMSDVDSMDQSVDMIRPDVTAMDTSAPISTVSEVVGDLGTSPPNSISPLAQDISLNNSEIPAAQSENNVAAFGSISAAATAGTTTVTQPANTTPTVPPTAPVAPSQNMVNSVTLAPKTTQNGSLQEPSPVVNSSPLLTSTPAKGPLNVTSEKYIPSSPSITQRKYIPNPSLSSQQLDPAQCFSVVSYNILADCHLRRYDYSFTEDQYLDQTYRHNLLMKELDYLTGDIVCMQEVGPAYYTNTLNPAMTSRGYTGHFIKRTKDFYEEGEATFVKNSRFEILATQGISLKELAYKEVDAAGLSEEVASAAKRYLDRADVVLLSKLACKNTGKQLTICNIHVVYDLASPDVQCVQVASAIKELVSKAGNDLSPHIICGDFNSEVTSPGYQLAKDGYLSDTHIRNLQAIERMDNKDGSSHSMIHHLWRAFQHTSSNLKSAYETVMGKEPNLTSYNKLTNAALDYLFFSSSSLDVAGALEVLDKQAAMATGGTPNKDIPSDHLSMKAVFKIKE